MRRVALLVILAAGCSRDLELPEPNLLTVRATKSSVAPRERLQLIATGGAGGYRWELREAERRSGPDATVDPVTGEYQAGRAGSALDEVRVVDANGAEATFPITVGPPLSVSPPATVVSPGGTVALTVTGGLPPYTFTLVPAPGSDSTVGADGLYVAGSVGSVGETILIGDATNDPAAVTRSDVRIGSALQIYPPEVAVAPTERVGFAALGGQPPYTFAVERGATGTDTVPASVDATGRYVAGSNDADVLTTDHVTVTDDNGQVARATVTVGRPLRLLAIGSEPHAGIPVLLSASGGKEPYTFRFAHNGNRTHGTLEPASGEYTPGPFVKATDLLEVRDATGAVTPPMAVEVRSLRTFAALGILGDARAFTRPRGGGAILTSALSDNAYGGLPGGSPTAIVVDVPYGELLGTTELLIPDGTMPRVFSFRDGPIDHLLLASNTGARVMPQTLDGSFLMGPTAGEGSMPGHYFASPAPGEAIGVDPFGTCAAGVARFLATSTQLTGQCVSLPLPIPSYALGTTAVDLDGACGDDVVVPTYDGPGNSAYVEYRSCDGLNFSSGERFVFPAGVSHVPGNSWIDTRTAQLPGAKAAAMLLSTGGTRSEVYFLKREAGVLALSGPVDPLGDGTATSFATVPSGGSDLVVAWGAGAGPLRAVRPSASGTGTPFDLLGVPLPYPVAQVLAVPSRHGPDLLVRSATGPVDVFLGDGDGGFGRHQHVGKVLQLGQRGPGAADADFDGDGVEDVVALRPDSSLSILFGGDHQVAAGPPTPLPYRPEWIASGDFFGDGHASVLFGQRLSDVQLARGLGDGRFLGLTPFTFDDQHPGCLLPTTSNYSITPVDLGGEATGPDLYINESWGGSPAFLIRTSTGAVHAGASVPAGGCGPWPVQASAGGAGPGLAATCVTTQRVVCPPWYPGSPCESWQYDYEVTNYSVRFAPLERPGGVPALGAWQQLTPTSPDLAGRTNLRLVGWLGAKTVFGLSFETSPSTYTLTAVEVDGSVTPPLVRESNLGFQWDSFHAIGSAVANVDEDGIPDILLATYEGIYVAKGTATGFDPAVRVGSLFDVPGDGPNLSPFRLSSGLGVDLLDIRADRQSGDMLVIANDGTGAFP